MNDIQKLQSQIIVFAYAANVLNVYPDEGTLVFEFEKEDMRDVFAHTARSLCTIKDMAGNIAMERAATRDGLYTYEILIRPSFRA